MVVMYMLSGARQQATLQYMRRTLRSFKVDIDEDR